MADSQTCIQFRRYTPGTAMQFGGLGGPANVLSFGHQDWISFLAQLEQIKEDVEKIEAITQDVLAEDPDT